MSRRSASMMVAAVLAIGGSCNGTSGGGDGGGGKASGSGGHAGGSGGSSGGSGGQATGGQGGIDNQCLSEGESCATTGALCCGGLNCCHGSTGQASCVVGSCTAAQGGHGGAGATGGGAGSGASGAGGLACLPDNTSCTNSNDCCSGFCRGSCQQPNVSDRNVKRDFAPVNDDEILKAVDSLPITSWSFKSDSTNARHIGPMAQDFMSTFHVGSNDKTILQVDGDGVSLAAIKALSQRVKDLEARNRALEQELAAVRAHLPPSHRRGGSLDPAGAP